MTVDAGLAREIAAVPAIDDHGHPLPIGAEEVDLEHPINPYDHSLGVRMRSTNSEYVDAWRALWGYEHDDLDPSHLADLIRTKIAAQRRPDYYPWLFGELGIEQMVYIGSAPDPQLDHHRFRWAAHVDWVLWPHSASVLRDHVLVPAFRAVNRERCARRGHPEPPPTLASYLDDVVLPELADARSTGAVALKVNTAYYRPIRFDPVPAEDAAPLYAAAARGEELSVAQHTALQDHLFRRILAAAGDLGLPVQVHTGLGANPEFTISNGNPLLLESVIHDFPRTPFVLLHAGWPFDREAIAALALQHVYLDISCVNIYLYPRRLSWLLRGALEWFPEKVLYGTDTHSDRSIGKLSGVPPRPNPLAGWEEKSWLVDRGTRRALGMALDGMLEDGELSAVQAVELAQDVLRRNALRLYDLTPHRADRRTG